MDGRDMRQEQWWQRMPLLRGTEGYPGHLSPGDKPGACKRVAPDEECPLDAEGRDAVRQEEGMVDLPEGP